MFKSNSQQINHISQTLNETKTFSTLMATCREIEKINKILARSIPSLVNICKCGALDYEKSTLVIFCHDNASFYKVNNLMVEIEDCLRDNKIFFDKILVKLVPNIQKQQRKQTTQIDKRLYPAMEKIIKTLNLNYQLDYSDKQVKNSNDDQEDEFIKL